jgi:transposase-like protein
MEECRREAVAQVSTRGHSGISFARPIGVSSKSLHVWVKLSGDEPDTRAADASQIKRLKAELRRMTRERDTF